MPWTRRSPAMPRSSRSGWRPTASSPSSTTAAASRSIRTRNSRKNPPSKAYLFGGVEIGWSCAPELLHGVEGVPVEETFHFPGGLTDFLNGSIHGATLVHPDVFAGSSENKGGHGTVEWAIAWVADADGFV